MEKRTPHCKLAVAKALIEAGKVRTTHVARAGANELGLDYSDMLAVVMALTSADFYKSMATHADHTVWQDVYRPSTQVGDVYLTVMAREQPRIMKLAMPVFPHPGPPPRAGEGGFRLATRVSR